VCGAELGEDTTLRSTTEDLLRSANRVDQTVDARVRALSRAAASLHGVDDRLAATALAAIDRADRASDAPVTPETRGCALAARAVCAAAAGDLGSYHDCIVGAVSALADARAPFASVAALLELGAALVTLGCPALAQNVFEAVEAEATTFGFAVVVALARQRGSLALARLGRLDEARAQALGAVESLSGASPRMAAEARASAARVLWLAGDAPAADELARTPDVPGEAPAARALALAIRADGRARAGDAAEAETLARTALHVLPAGDAAVAGFVELLCVRALERVGDPRSAAGVRANAAERLRKQAATIRDPSLRESFFHGVPEHVALLLPAP
jgi:hypothetical protein